MSCPVSKIDGVSSFAAAKLKVAGIRTSEALLERARTARGRKLLAAETGIGEQQLLEWANIADCMRIKGMGRARTQLLRAAGVKTVRDLSYRNPGRLAQAMKDANDERKLLRVPPSEKAIGQMIEHARKLPLKISY